jgi:hypothetical protein
LANGKEFDLSTITTTIANLNNTFPNALTQQDSPVTTTTTAAATTAAAATTPAATTPAATTPAAK